MLSKQLNICLDFMGSWKYIFGNHHHVDETGLNEDIEDVQRLSPGESEKVASEMGERPGECGISWRRK